MKAVIDIGSNSVRLLVFNDRSDFVKGVTATEITRLGHKLLESGHLSKAGIAATWKAFDLFAEILKDHGIVQVEAYATEAVRKATDGEAFVQEVTQRYGWHVRIIDGEEEALIGFLGATSALPEGSYTMLDIGGASTEMIQGSAQLEYRHSFPIGALRLTDEPHTDLSEVFADLPPLRGELIGIGGTITTVLAMTLALETYERKFIHGKKLTKAALQKWVDIFPSMPQALRLQLPGLDPKREPIIWAGMKILLHLMERFNQTELIVSDYGNLEGYAMSRGLCDTNTLT